MRWLTKIIGGGILAQVISLIFYPFITRQFDPVAFSALGSFTLLTGIFSIFIGIKSESFVNIVGKSDLESSVSDSIKLILSSFLSLVVFALALSILLNNYLIILAFSAATMVNLYVLSLNYTTRLGNVNAINKSKIIQTLLSNFFIVLGGLIFPNFLFLVGGYVINQTAGTFQLLRASKFKIRRPYLIGIEYFASFYIERKGMLLFFIKNSILNTILPYFLFIVYTQTGQLSKAGYVILGTQIIGIPQSIIRRSVAQYLVYSADRVNSFEQLFKKIIIFSAIGVVLIIPVADIFFKYTHLIFGEKWRNASDILLIMLFISISDYFYYICFQYSSIRNLSKTGNIIDYFRAGAFAISSLSIFIFRSDHYAIYIYIAFIYVINFAFLYLIYKNPQIKGVKV